MASSTLHVTVPLKAEALVREVALRVLSSVLDACKANAHWSVPDLANELVKLRGDIAAGKGEALCTEREQELDATNEALRAEVARLTQKVGSLKDQVRHLQMLVPNG